MVSMDGDVMCATCKAGWSMEWWEEKWSSDCGVPDSFVCHGWCTSYTVPVTVIFTVPLYYPVVPKIKKRKQSNSDSCKFYVHIQLTEKAVLKHN